MIYSHLKKNTMTHGISQKKAAELLKQYGFNELLLQNLKTFGKLPEMKSAEIKATTFS